MILTLQKRSMHYKLLYLFLVAIIFTTPASAQTPDRDILAKYKIYDEDRLPASFHRSRRDSIRALLTDETVALFIAAPVKNRANDVDYEYHQDPNFYYLTGHIQPEAALLVTTKGDIFFTAAKDPSREQWTGVRLGTEGAKELLGFREAHPISELSEMLGEHLRKASIFYYDPPTVKKHHDIALDSVFSIWDQTVSAIKAEYPKVELKSLRSRLAELRMRKTPEEMKLLRMAITISNTAHNEILKQVRPGWTEYQIQALGEYVFKKNGCEYTGYPCIVGTGNNGAVLHYITNRAQTVSGDMIVMDIGGEYHGYTADVTRSFPVNGKFTDAQRTIYNLVLASQDSGIANCRSGKGFRDPHFAALRVIQKGLLKLGIITDTSDYRKYFMHGTSHYLGLDVHDPGTFGPLEPNVVLTVEPGVYIPEGSPCDKKWWGISCRIEDDILVTTGDPENLSIASPRTADDVERMMSGQHPNSIGSDGSSQDAFGRSSQKSVDPIKR